jgi:hypothetical protein
MVNIFITYKIYLLLFKNNYKDRKRNLRIGFLWWKPVVDLHLKLLYELPIVRQMLQYKTLALYTVQ